jgi:hypothetical protein
VVEACLEYSGCSKEVRETRMKYVGARKKNSVGLYISMYIICLLLFEYEAVRQFKAAWN